MKKYYKVDAGSMYPNIFISFCLSPENYVAHIQMPEYFPSESSIEEDINKGYKHWSKTKWGEHCIKNSIIPVPVTYRQSIEDLKKDKDYRDNDFTTITPLRGIYYFKQNPDGILCKAFDAPMKWKAGLKENLKNTPEKHPNKKILKEEYDACKRFSNTGFGGSGNPYGRLFKLEVFNADTFLARDMMLYVKNKADSMGYDIVLIDTDSFVIYSEENILDLLNVWAKEWAYEKYGNKRFNLTFDKEGYFKSLYVGGKCRYMGYLVKANGDIETEIKGLQIKRKSSTEFQKIEQRKFIDFLLEGHEIKEIESYIEKWIKRVYKQDILTLATPCKFSKPRERYGKKEEFFLAYDNSQSLWPKFKKEIDNKFWYIQVEGDLEVLAFDKEYLNIFKDYKIDYKTIIHKQIFNLLVPTFSGLNLGKELLDLAERHNVLLESSHRNTLLEEYDNYSDLKEYYSAREYKNRKKEVCV